MPSLPLRYGQGHASGLRRPGEEAGVVTPRRLLAPTLQISKASGPQNAGSMRRPLTLENVAESRSAAWTACRDSVPDDQPNYGTPAPATTGDRR
jgi:hypothetical protein